MHTSYIELQEVTILPIIALNGVTRLTKVFEFKFFSFNIKESKRVYIIQRLLHNQLGSKICTLSAAGADWWHLYLGIS